MKILNYQIAFWIVGNLIFVYVLYIGSHWLLKLVPQQTIVPSSFSPIEWEIPHAIAIIFVYVRYIGLHFSLRLSPQQTIVPSFFSPIEWKIPHAISLIFV